MTQQPKGNVVRIPLTRGYSTIVDEVDADLAAFKWNVDISRLVPYAVRKNPSKRPHLSRMHRVIMERVLGRPLEKKELVDHKNRNGLDNRRSNLRIATDQQNKRNVGLSSKNTSGYKGVRWDKSRNKWQAVIGVDGKSIHLGRFATILDAARAYNEAAIKYFGEFAYLNDIPTHETS